MMRMIGMFSRSGVGSISSFACQQCASSGVCWRQDSSSPRGVCTESQSLLTMTWSFNEFLHSVIIFVKTTDAAVDFFNGCRVFFCQVKLVFQNCIISILVGRQEGHPACK